MSRSTHSFSSKKTSNKKGKEASFHHFIVLLLFDYNITNCKRDSQLGIFSGSNKIPKSHLSNHNDNIDANNQIK